VAAGQTSEDQRAALAAGAAREVFERGWATQAFERFSREALDRFAVQKALSGRPDPDVDTPQSGTGALQYLKLEIAGDRHAREAFDRGRSKVATYLREQAPGKLVSEVRPLRPAKSGEPELGDALTPEQFFGRILPSAEQFLLAEIWTDKAQAGTLHRVERSQVWAPDGIGPVVDEAKVEWMDMAEIELPGGGLSLKAVRLDCSTACNGTDLRIFATAPAFEGGATVIDEPPGL
jgi:hypothetical protein